MDEDLHSAENTACKLIPSESESLRQIRLYDATCNFFLENYFTMKLICFSTAFPKINGCKQQVSGHPDYTERLW